MKVSDVYFSCYKLTAQVGGLTQDKLSFLENILQFCTSTKIRESLSLLFFYAEAFLQNVKNLLLVTL